MRQLDAVVVGGGLAGLVCARHLHRAGKKLVLVEAAERVGGRVATDHHEGFLLDRGFQVLLTAYPECRAELDYGALDLRAFEPGCLIWHDGGLRRLSDPWRRPVRAVATLLSPVGSIGDKVKVGRLRRNVRRADPQELMSRPERSSVELLLAYGFSDAIIERFFRPFLGGVFLDAELRTSSRMLEFVFAMFSSGEAVLPSGGMGAIAEQLASTLPPDSIRLGASVESITGGRVRLQDGEFLEATAIVIATDGQTASRFVEGVEPLSALGTVCIYFDAPDPPISEPILVLNGEGDGPVNELCVPSQIAPSYAPRGRSLISASIIDGANAPDTDLVASATEQLRGWFGDCVNSWRHLRTYRIPEALPARPGFRLDPPQLETRIRSGLYVCGDHRDTASINGAMASGRRAAQAALEDLGS